MTPVYLSNFESIRPEFTLTQEDTLKTLVQLRMKLHPERHQLERERLEKKVQRYAVSGSKIRYRGTEIGDYALESDNVEDFSFFTDFTLPNLTHRMSFYSSKTCEVMNRFYPMQDADSLPDHLVHVSCTGYTSPNAAQRIAAEWNQQKIKRTMVTNAYHMGCYASLPAIRIAEGIIKGSSHRTPPRVDLVHNEICSLHFDPTSLEAEQLVVQSLFADGHIRYSLESKKQPDCLEVLALHEEIVPESTEMMTWDPGPNHFKMTLSREVPRAISENLKPFVDYLLDCARFDKSAPLIFAVHPGGPKIIEGVEAALQLQHRQTEESHSVLGSYGNMSSATLPHIWKEILENPERESGSYVVSLAFGPGLTLSGGVFRLWRS